MIAYGATELSSPCVQSGTRDRSLPLMAAGTLIANTEMVFLQDDGIRVNAIGSGEILVRGPNIMMYVWTKGVNLFSILTNAIYRGCKGDLTATKETILDRG